MKRVGNTSARCPRTIVTRPSSSGCLSASTVVRWNSDSSSRNRIPRLASDASPGRGGLPPPTSPAAEIVWCGARNGRVNNQPAAVQPRDAVHPRHLERLGPRHRRQDRRQPPRQHRLAGPGWSLQQQIVPAGRGDLQRLQRNPVTAHVRQIGLRRNLRRRCHRSRGCRWQTPTGDGVDRRPQATDRQHPESVDQRRLAPLRCRHDQCGDPVAARAFSCRQRAGGRSQLTAQRELAVDGDVRQQLRSRSGHWQRAPPAPGRRRSQDQPCGAMPARDWL